MFSKPPRTMTTPAAQRMRGPKRFSNISGMVIAPESRSGLMQKPVRPMNPMAMAWQRPGMAPANPFS